MADGVLPPLATFGTRRSSGLSPRILPAQLEDTSMLPRRLSHAKGDDALLNSLEAEEERLVLLLTRKLEVLRVDKAHLENAADAENESMVLKLQRQLAALQQQQQQQAMSPSESTPASPLSTMRPLPTQLEIEPSIVVDALKTENDQLRSRLATTEIAYTRERRLNDVYKCELVELRSRLDMDTSDLVGSPASSARITPTPANGTIPSRSRSFNKGSQSRDRSNSNSGSILSTLSSDVSFSPPVSSSTPWQIAGSNASTSYSTTPSTSYRLQPTFLAYNS